MLLPTNRKSHTAFPLTYLDMTLAHTRGQREGRAHFDSKYLADRTNITIADKLKVAYGLLFAYLHLTLAHSKGQDQEHAHFDCGFLTHGDR